MIPFIYLASSSPRRYELLSLLGIPFERLIPDIPEVRAHDESPRDYVLRLAQSKAQAGVLLAKRDCPALGADTIVLLGEQILEKPANREHAAEMLRLLSGRRHKVMTAIALADRENVLTHCVETEVQFCQLSEQEIADYIATGEPMDKAGGYGIQGNGGCFVRAINGSYHNVVGLPLVETKELINQFITEKTHN